MAAAASSWNPDWGRVIRLKIMVGSGADGSTYAHGTQALDLEMLVKRAGLTPARAIQGGTIEIQTRPSDHLLIGLSDPALARTATP